MVCIHQVLADSTKNLGSRGRRSTRKNERKEQQGQPVGLRRVGSGARCEGKTHNGWGGGGQRLGVGVWGSGEHVKEGDQKEAEHAWPLRESRRKLRRYSLKIRRGTRDAMSREKRKTAR